ELCTLMQFTLNFDRSPQPLHNIVYVAQSQTKTFDIMNIPGGNTIELIENTAQLCFVHSHAIVFDRKIKLFLSRSCTNLDNRSALCIFDRVVEQIKDDIGEMKFIAKHNRIPGF